MADHGYDFSVSNTASAPQRPKRPIGAATPEESPEQAGPIDQRFDVGFSYRVWFVDGVFTLDDARLADAIAPDQQRRRPSVLVFLDSGVAAADPSISQRIVDYFRAWSSRCRLVADPIVVEGGEAAKQGWSAIEPLFGHLRAFGLDRHDTVVTVGGGAVLDATGFVAATAHRGVRHVRIPTTVLSQNDSAVGVKNAINGFGSKNFIGTFAPPTAVLIDVSLLATLEVRDRCAGMAEAVKVAAIRDAAFFEWLEDHVSQLVAFERSAVAQSVRRAAVLHLEHIRDSGDPFEQGNARPLDFGHWVAHKLESMSDHALRHGEAVAIGMCVDTSYAAATGVASGAVRDRISVLLAGLGLPTSHSLLAQRGASGTLTVLDGLEEFRQHLGGDLSITLLSDIGRGLQVGDIDRAVMEMVCQSLAH